MFAALDHPELSFHGIKPATQVMARIGFQWATACQTKKVHATPPYSGCSRWKRQAKDWQRAWQPVGSSSSVGRAFVAEVRGFERKPQDFFEDVGIFEQKQALAGIACIAAICLACPVQSLQCCKDDASSSSTAIAPHTTPSEGNGLEREPRMAVSSKISRRKRWENMLYLQHVLSSQSAAQGNMVSAAEVHVSANSPMAIHLSNTSIYQYKQHRLAETESRDSVLSCRLTLTFHQHEKDFTFRQWLLNKLEQPEHGNYVLCCGGQWGVHTFAQISGFPMFVMLPFVVLIISYHIKSIYLSIYLSLSLSSLSPSPSQEVQQS